MKLKRVRKAMAEWLYPPDNPVEPTVTVTHEEVGRMIRAEINGMVANISRARHVGRRY